MGYTVQIPVCIKGDELEIVENFTFMFLGVNITNLIWCNHIDNAAKKAHQGNSAYPQWLLPIVCIVEKNPIRMHCSLVWQMHCPRLQVIAENFERSTDHSHSSPFLFPFPTTRSYKRLNACTTTFRNSFFPTILWRLLNASLQCQSIPNLSIYLVIFSLSLMHYVLHSCMA